MAELWESRRGALVREGAPLSTIDAYDCAAKRIKQALGGVRLGECNSLMLYNFLTTLNPGTAHHARSVLSGMFQHAITSGAIERNVIKDVPSTAKAARKKLLKSRPAKRPRALGSDEAEGLIRQLRASELPCPPEKNGKQQPVKGYCPTVHAYAASADLVDIAVMLNGTGLRIGELLGLLWSDIDFKAKTLTLSGKITRGTGRGLVREDFTKSGSAGLTIGLSPKIIAMLAERKKAQALGTRHGFVSATKIEKGAELLPLVFPAKNGSLRDPNNTHRQWRRVRVALGLDWVVPHTFRKTVATSLEKQGFTAREIADQLGHAHVSTTQNHYFGRGEVRHDIAAALDKNIG
ncbi:MAG: site-specific integrase [Segniliparus sp.]|uniref:site-specific integrase n=1 Tax=Segniliparus sp. TaxID=2804064 RepID=UPI003F35D76F